MLVAELIRRKRDGHALDPAEIAHIARGLSDGSIPDAQIAAFAMAVFFRGMTTDEAVALTLAMRDSGTVLDWSGIGRPVVDKHSTGGIGDTVSLMLAPALAACGAAVPMVSGRGLGHTGGTLDKLDAVPGYDARPDPDRLRRVVAEVGCAVIGQTDAIAPADRRFYALRDVTATVESIPLITASILSKKLAAGLEALVLDVKFGSGAFMATMDAARDLAESLVGVANGAGCRTAALLTDMNEPLGSAAGNALEVRLAVDFLTGARIDPRMWAVTAALGGEALALAGLAPDAGEGRARIEGAFRSGAAAETFGRMIAALGGPADLIQAPGRHLAAAPVVQPVVPDEAGVVAAIDTRAIGLAVIGLGGGRRVATDRIDPRVGFSDLAGIGAEVGRDRPLAMVHAADADSAARAANALRVAYRIGDETADAMPPVAGRIGPGS
ncbi:MAG: thymidine phosphorylase [Gemmobacter sp.]